MAWLWQYRNSLSTKTPMTVMVRVKRPLATIARPQCLTVKASLRKGLVTASSLSNWSISRASRWEIFTARPTLWWRQTWAEAPWLSSPSARILSPSARTAIIR